jgi:hypothetical protein
LKAQTPKSRRAPRRKVEREQPDVTTALQIAELLWPDFVLEGGATFVKSAREGAPQTIQSLGGLLEAEWFVNHTHVLDNFVHGALLPTEPFWDSTHQDFARACRLGEIMCETWAAKLRRDAPDEDYAVYCTRDDNPIVRFHKIREPDDVYFDPATHPAGTVLMIRSRDGRRTGRIDPPSSSRPKRIAAGRPSAGRPSRGKR